MTLNELEQRIITEFKKYEINDFWKSFENVSINVYNKIMYKIPLDFHIPYLINSKSFTIEDDTNICLSNKQLDYIETKKHLLSWARNNSHRVIITKFLGYWLLWTTEFIVDICDFYVFVPSIEIPKEILDCIVFKPKTHTFNYVISKGYGFDNKELTIKDLNIDLKTHYNDSLPIDAIDKFIKSNSSGLAIFHGPPGCGKSTYLRHLININPNLKFYILDSSMFKHITEAAFVDYLLNNKNGIFILEDCESLLASRDCNYNNTIASLLNISDGMLGDELNIKFICTFNTNLKNIDAALLRKGRLKIKYEFNKLDKNKAQHLINSLGRNYVVDSPMALCDIYNSEENNGTDTKKKIGF